MNNPKKKQQKLYPSASTTLSSSPKKSYKGRRRSNTESYAGPIFNNAPAPSTIPIPSLEKKDLVHEIQRDLRSLLKI